MESGPKLIWEMISDIDESIVLLSLDRDDSDQNTSLKKRFK